MSKKVLGKLVLFSKCWIKINYKTEREEENHFLGTVCWVAF